MKKQLVTMALAIAIPMSVFARSQGGTHQRSGTTSLGNQRYSMTSPGQMGQMQSMTQMGRPHQMRGNVMGHNPVNGTQNIGSGNMSQGHLGNMNPNGNGNGMGNGTGMGMGQGQSGTPQQP